MVYDDALVNAGAHSRWVWNYRLKQYLYIAKENITYEYHVPEDVWNAFGINVMVCGPTVFFAMMINGVTPHCEIADWLEQDIWSPTLFDRTGLICSLLAQNISAGLQYIGNLRRGQGVRE